VNLGDSGWGGKTVFLPGNPFPFTEFDDILFKLWSETNTESDKVYILEA